jgi:hypothetical protein
MTPPRDPFELRLSEDQKKVLSLYLHDELQKGLDARGATEHDVDYWYQLYEQARTRTGAPWQDAADLTSHIGTEHVDSLQARIMANVWSDPIWTVEGWGPSADRAPFVEEFHQWKAEEERLQGVLDRLVLQSLIEPRGLLEIAEGTDLRTTRKRITAKVETDPLTGGMIYDEDMNPQASLKPDGTFMEAGPDDIGIEQVIDSTERIRTGPTYRILPYKDSLITPGHARDKADIWGYWKRFWMRESTLTAKAKAGMYDEDAVEKISKQDDRESDDSLQRANQSVPKSDAGLAEKELWEGLVLLNLNDLFEARRVPKLKKGGSERWYLVTLHPRSQQILRVQFDDMERSRFVPVILFPRPDRATEGYSFIGHKLITLLEEHGAWRNMAADRGAMVIGAPIQRLQGALWDPMEQPFGPKAVIDVRSMDEVRPFVVPDLSQSTFHHIEMVERTAQRVSGINDVASGQVATQNRTLGEVQMATEQSFVRMRLITQRFQEAMEDIGQIRHAIWQRVAAEQPEGMEAPQSLLSNLEGRGVTVDLPDGKITSALLSGSFRLKPYGSNETADPNRQRNDFVGMLQALPPTMQAFPQLGAMFATPQAARAMGRQLLRVFRVPNQQAFLGSPAQDLMQTQAGQMLTQLMQQPQGPGMMGMQPPGLPPGPPPQPEQLPPPPTGGPLPQ